MVSPELVYLIDTLRSLINEQRVLVEEAKSTDRWLTDQEAADELGIRLNSFRSNVKQRIPHSTRGKKCIRLSDLNAYREEYMKLPAPKST